MSINDALKPNFNAAEAMQAAILEAEVRKCLIGFRHTVNIFTLLNCPTLALNCIDQFTSKTLWH